MQVGISFIVSDFPAWQVETSKATPGLYVNLESTDETLSATIRYCASADRRREMGNVGNDYVRNHINWDRLEMTSSTSWVTRGMIMPPLTAESRE